MDKSISIKTCNWSCFCERFPDNFTDSNKTDVLKNIFVSALLVILLWSCDAGEGKSTRSKDTVAKAAIPEPTLSEEEKKFYHDKIVAYFSKTSFLKRFNGSILIAKNGVPVFEMYKGFSNFITKDSVDAESPLQIASTCKPFTAAAVLQLAEQGKLSLDDLVSKYFPGFPYTEVTIKSLLNHRSGLPNYINYMYKDVRWPDQNKLATNEDVLNTLFTWNQPQSYRPNVRFNYCNTNYVMLALIVEKVTGVPFPQYMKTNFFDKLGMKNTFVATIGDTAAVLSSKRDGYVWPMDYSDGPYGDKNMYSTPRDLLKWDRAWYNGLVVSKAMADSSYQPYSNERPSRHNYGLGWRLIFTPNGKKVIYHNGKWHGFYSAFARLTEEDATIIILSNKGSSGVYHIARGLYNVFGNYDGKHDEGED
jgi:CubicO group peptidase (beta-lactamase class C family)